MAANYVTFVYGVYLKELLLEQRENRIAYVYTNDAEFARFLNQQIISEIEYAVHSRLEFLANITQYFRSERSITEALMVQRHAEVSLIRFFFT